MLGMWKHGSYEEGLSSIQRQTKQKGYKEVITLNQIHKEPTGAHYLTLPNGEKAYLPFGTSV